MIFRCKNKILNFGEKTYIMGILNVTPDSFSDGGKYNDTQKAIDRALKMIEEGADIIDVGGESTRPGHVVGNPMMVYTNKKESRLSGVLDSIVSEEEEIRRVVPVIEKLATSTDVVISVDTMKPNVAQRALQAGAHIVNDIWGLQKEPDIAQIAAEHGAGVIMMHNSTIAEYNDVLNDIIKFLQKSIEIGKKAGLGTDQMIIDPGIGFGKTLEHNLEIMNKLDELKVLNLPILLGTSRKSMIGKVLGLEVNDRVEGTAATVAVGITKGVDIVRVHDVMQMFRVAKMTDAMVRR
ncbi:MAG: dihydropteroate synthase [Thermoanaerobacteraceae bacterium]